MPSYSNSVFVNCPFDDEYQPTFHAVVFAVMACGFVPRCSLEHDNAAETRIEKIYRLISQCHMGIHDISRTELNTANNLPRFNMPLELGMFLGARQFGNAKHKQKRCLILDTDKYRFQKFVSDIAGQDIRSHNSDPQQAIRQVRDWLRSGLEGEAIPGAAHIWQRYQQFQEELPALCAGPHLEADHLIFNDYTELTAEWLRTNL